MFQPYRPSPTASTTVAMYMFIKINSLITPATVAPLFADTHFRSVHGQPIRWVHTGVHSWGPRTDWCLIAFLPSEALSVVQLQRQQREKYTADCFSSNNHTWSYQPHATGYSLEISCTRSTRIETHCNRERGFPVNIVVGFSLPEAFANCYCKVHKKVVTLEALRTWEIDLP